MTEEYAKGNFFSHWFRNRPLRAKIMILVVVVGIMLSVTVVMSINQNRIMDQHVDELVSQDLALESEILELSIAAEEMIVSIQEYVISPDDRSTSKSNYDNAVLNIEGHIDNINTILDGWDNNELDITESVDEIYSDVNMISPLAEGNSASEGIFSLAVDQDEILEEFELAVEEVDSNIDALLDLITGHINQSVLIPTIMDLNDEISNAESHTLHFMVQYDQDDKHTAEYILGISNTSSLVTNGVTQLSTYIQTIRSAILESDVNENNLLNEITDDVYHLKLQVTQTFAYKVELESLIHEINALSLHLEEELDIIIDDIHKYADDQIVELDENFNQTMFEILIILGASVIISIGFTYFTSNIVVKPVKNVQAAMEQVSEGDLTHILRLEHGHLHTDEIGHLEESLIKMQENLRSLVKSIIANSNSLTASSEELASAAEETNAATEEVSSTSQSMSQAASQQAEMIAVSVEEITKINSVVNDIIEQIQHNSDVISQIALQTNILALNAGIEASRAGDYGRGFAVVAENVRRLSEESKRAAEEITEVAASISDTLTNAFDSIKIQIEEVAALSEETAASAEEVAAAAEEVTSSMEEVSASSQDLSEQAIIALDEVSVFKVGNSREK